MRRDELLRTVGKEGTIVQEQRHMSEKYLRIISEKAGPTRACGLMFEDKANMHHVCIAHMTISGGPGYQKN
uniref:Uncharacterized protein n=1 Tax=Peronospora matthiolae TaxID=2874970 RepID=A0AAV1T2I2_9STRA